MEFKAWMTIGEFAKLSGVSRKNLIYYDNIGLFSPEKIGKNGYRYYGYHQLDTIWVIYALKEIGMPLKEIEVYLNERSPNRLIEVFERQKKKIDLEIQKLTRISDMMEKRLEMTRESMTVTDQVIELKRCSEEWLYLSHRMTDYSDAGINAVLQEYFESCLKMGISYGAPLGDMLEKEKILKECWQEPSYYYIQVPEEMKKLPGVVRKVPGSYMIGYIRGDYECADQLYASLLREIGAQGLKVVGSGYRETLLDEIAVKSSKDYFFRISIKVEKTV